MRIGPIDNNPVTSSGKVGNLTPVDSQPRTSASGEQVSFSQKLQLVRRLSKTFQQVPEVRHQYIEAVKQKLASQDYRVDSKQIAERIIEQLTLFDETDQARGNYRAAA